MKSSIVATEIAEPYARALLSVTQEAGSTDAVNAAASELLTLLNESDELADFLASPLASPDAKKGVIRQVLGEDANPSLANFLQLLVDRGRAALLIQVLEQYKSLVREVNQTVLAEVTSAIKLSDSQKESIRQKVAAMTGANAVELNTEIDADLLGGVIIKVGSQIVDASLRGQLRRIGVQLGAASA